MSVPESSINGSDLLILKALENPEFRKQLIASPEAAASGAGIEVPAGLKLVIHEDTVAELNLVIGGQSFGFSEKALALLARAQQDAALKARLFEDPTTTIRVEIGVAMPEGLKINVFENSASEIHIVLPMAELPEGELSEQQLEGVAGGLSLAQLSGQLKGIKPDPKQQLAQLQMQQQKITQMTQLMTNLAKQSHDMHLSGIGNLR